MQWCLNVFFTYLFIINSTLAWDSEQLQVFDVVEEVKDNFYDLFNISKESSSSEIRSAYRVLTLKLHPDKNLDVDTSEQFRNLVSVYDVLKNPTKRKYYDEILINGLPNWRSAVYYYRYVRKMGITEACIILFIISTIGQYIVNWAAYFEKKFIQQQLKKRKPGRKGKNYEEEMDIYIPKPSFLQTLPFQIPKIIWISVISIPTALGLIKTAVAQQIEEATKVPTEPEPEPVKIKTIRKRNKFVVPEGPNFETFPTEYTSDGTASVDVPIPITGGLWTDDDLVDLIKLVNKFPQGSSKRWENIAAALERSVSEVTYMAHKMKDNGYRIPSEKEVETLINVKQKTKKDTDIGDNVKKWSQVQQKALEEALAKNPKGCMERWDKIASHVPGKTKEECMLRFKYLAEILKKQQELTLTEANEIEKVNDDH